MATNPCEMPTGFVGGLLKIAPTLVSTLSGVVLGFVLNWWGGSRKEKKDRRNSFRVGMQDVHNEMEENLWLLNDQQSVMPPILGREAWVAVRTKGVFQWVTQDQIKLLKEFYTSALQYNQAVQSFREDPRSEGKKIGVNDLRTNLIPRAQTALEVLQGVLRREKELG